METSPHPAGKVAWNSTSDKGIERIQVETRTEPQISVGSIAEIARQVRAEKATEEKPKVVIKQDAEGRPEIIDRKQRSLRLHL